MTQGVIMEFPRNAIILHSLITHGDGKIYPANSVVTVTERLGETHAYKGHLIDKPETSVYLHSTDLVFVKEGVEPNLLRRALKRYTFEWNQSYLTARYNSLIEFKLRIRDRDLEFCLTSEDAIKLAVQWDERHSDPTNTEYSQAVCYRQREEYLRYAEDLEQFERCLDRYYQEQTQ